MRFRNSFIITALLVCFIVSSGFTQVYYEQVTTSNGIGGKMAFTSQTNVYLTSSAKYEKTDMQFTGSFMKHFNKQSNRAEITRLDKECFWSVDFDNKSYTETTFAQLKQMFENMAKNPPAQETEKPEEAVDESEYEWQKPVVSVKEGDTKKINGFNCKNYIVNVLTVGKHKQTGVLDTMLFVSDMWNSTVEAKAMTQIKEFEQNLMQKLGFDKPEMGMGQMLAAYKEYFKQMSEETQKLKGYPVQNTVRMTISNHAQAALKKDSASEPEEESVDVNKSIGGMLGGFGKKMIKNKVKKQSTDSGAAKEVFQFTHELKVLKMEDVAASKFDIPDGFKKIETPQNTGAFPGF